MCVEVRKSAIEQKLLNSDGLDGVKTGLEAVMQDSDLPGVSSAISLIRIEAFLRVFRLI